MSEAPPTLIPPPAALRDFLRFHAATGRSVNRSDPPEFGKKLLAAR